MRENNCCLSLNIKLRTNGHNNSQHCWPNNVGSCCLCLNAAKSLTCFKLCATTPNNTQPHATGCAKRRNVNIKQYWELLANNVASVFIKMVKVLLGIERFCDVLNYERKQLLRFFKYKAAYKRTQQFPTLLAQ